MFLSVVSPAITVIGLIVASLGIVAYVAKWLPEKWTDRLVYSGIGIMILGGVASFGDAVISMIKILLD